ncbi:MAG: chromosome segregation protein SMC, partial [Lachnospiraceae bacterium]|nr:chromosome segregation protein SMC [Lachnospiraceae bacterium]
ENQDLLRITDILTELEKQLGPLERQAEKAKEYLKKKETLKDCEVHIFLLEMENMKAQLQKIEETRKITQGDLDETTAAFENTKLEYDRIEQELEAVEKEIDAAKEEASQARVEKQQLKGKIAVLEEQARSAKASTRHYDERMEAIVQELAGRVSERGTITEEKDALDLQLTQAQKVQEDAQQRLTAVQQRIADSQTNMENSKSEIMLLLNGRGSIKGKLQRYAAMEEQNQIRVSEINAKLIAMKSEELDQQELMAERQRELDQASKELRQKTEERAQIEQRISALQQQITICRKRVEDAQSAYHREASRLESLRNLAERYDGYGGSIRRVMEQRSHQKGICGVVADLMQTEKRYETAIETALGGSIQNVVTEDEETAKQLIAYLKQNRLGRVTFLPLSAVRRPQEIKQQEALREPGVLGLADSLVQTEERYRAVMAHLLGRTIVVDEIDHAIKLQRKYRQSLRIVTLEGELLNPGGAMTGGAFKNSSSLLSRNREIEELKTKADKLKRDLESAQARLLELQNERSSCYSTLDQGAAALQELRVRENTTRMSLEQEQARMEAADSSREAFEQELSELRRQTEEIADLKHQNQTELEDSEKMERAHSCAVEVYQKRLETDREEEAEASRELEALHLDTASILQK